MGRAIDAAAFLTKTYGLSGIKLQKILYYAQATAMVTRGTPLFPEAFEAWVNGPVCREVWLQEQSGDAEAVGEEARAILQAAWERYGHLSAEELSDLSHRDDPWKKARIGLLAQQRSREVIPVWDMENFYLARELRKNAQGIWEHSEPPYAVWQAAKMRLILKRQRMPQSEEEMTQFIHRQVIASQRLEGVIIPDDFFINKAQ